jgi:hypothetical protein
MTDVGTNSANTPYAAMTGTYNAPLGDHCRNYDPYPKEDSPHHVKNSTSPSDFWEFVSSYLVHYLRKAYFSTSKMKDPSESSASSADGEEVEMFSQSSETEQEKKVQQVTKPQLAEKETKVVNRSKIVVYLVILVAAISVACIIYSVLRAAEKSNYEAKVGLLERFHYCFQRSGFLFFSHIHVLVRSIFEISAGVGRVQYQKFFGEA